MSKMKTEFEFRNVEANISMGGNIKIKNFKKVVWVEITLGNHVAKVRGMEAEELATNILKVLKSKNLK